MRTLPRTIGAMVAAGAIALTLSSCTSSLGPEPSPSTSVPTLLRGLSDVRCEADAEGNWDFSAKVQNPDALDARYTVTPTVVRNDAPDGEPVGSQEIKIEVKANATEPVEANGFARTEPGSTEFSCIVLANQEKL